MVRSCNDKYFGDALCTNQVAFTLTIMYPMDLVLFFLDTIKYKPKVHILWAVGRFSHFPFGNIGPCVTNWNAIIISMCSEHLLSIDHVQKLLYHQVDIANGRRSLRAPPFFISQSDHRFKGFLPKDREAERRISFFAQSLTTAIPESIPVDAMPTFTVLTPHYSEKLREVFHWSRALADVKLDSVIFEGNYPRGRSKHQGHTP
jgi:1,3-beta-glucan synthase